MKKPIVLLFIFYSTFNFAQIKGVITDNKGVTIPNVSVLIENTYIGTSANEQGKYELNFKKTGKHSVVYKSIGYKTKKIMIDISSFPYLQNVVLENENYQLTEVIVNRKNNPANAIIKSAIANRKENGQKTAHFKADFYSRGIFKLKNSPKKFMGIEIGDMDGNLDSTGTGIIYLSETVSKIIFEKPNNLKERIIASKVSGNDKGFSYNTARSTAYDFYENTVNFGGKTISPIANNAFGYYKFKLESSFFDENNQMIHKIKVAAKRDKEPVFDGYIYIVEDSWAIYAIDLTIKGYRMHQEMIETMNLKQNFGFNQTNKIWSKNTQSMVFYAGLFGIKFEGKFNYVYSNYEFETQFAPKTFGNEIVSFDENANKKDSLFWNKNRPIPLTVEEAKDYIKKDSVFKTRNSKTYLDSIDKKSNKFKLISPFLGYSYTNTFQKYKFKYDGIFGPTSSFFNTVQGWYYMTGFSYKNWKNEEKGKETEISTQLNLGLAEHKLRFTAHYEHQFNNQNYATLKVDLGNKVNQFNNSEPISELINSISTLFFKDNYMKLYNKEFLKINYFQDIANGVNLNATLEYQNRKALLNNTDFVILNTNHEYTSNNPILPQSYDSFIFEPHNLVKSNLEVHLNFGNKYISRPDGKMNLRSRKYPKLRFGFENTFAASQKSYEYQLLTTQIKYKLSANTKGEFQMNFKAGKFFNAKDIAFSDYKHFNGNQTHIGGGVSYTNVFNLMPYYSHSTNDAFFETHIEYNDDGYFTNKLPLINLLKATLTLGFHQLSVPKIAPYTEYTIGLDNLGFGKFRLFRLDYGRAYQNGFQSEALIFGLKIGGILD